MNWLISAFLAAVFNAMMDFFTKMSAGKIHDGAGSILICLFAAIPPTLYTVFSKISNHPVNINKEGLIYSALAGLTVGVATIFTFRMFASGVNLSVAVPVLRIGIILLASLMGVLILKEGVNLKLVLGFCLAICGLFLIVRSRI